MNTWGVIMMMALMSAVLLGGHFFLYFSLVRFLGIGETKIKVVLALALFLLSISFIVASVLAHYSENVFTREIYFLTSLWLAVGWNLSLTLMLSWMVVGVAKLFNADFDYKYLVILSFLGTAMLSGYGIWSAYHPRLKNITVEMRNLPEKWQGKKIVQLSDVHLGHIYGKKFLTDVVAQVNAEKPDMVVITGDLFDGMDGRLEDLVAPFNGLNAPDGTYFVTGNHETYLGVGEILAVLKNTPVHTLDNAVVDVDGMQILGISYPVRGEKSDNLADAIRKVSNFEVTRPNILLYHNPIEAISAKAIGIDLQLAGHTHSGQLFPFQWITRFVYGKYYYGLTVAGDFSAYTSTGVGTWGPTMRTSGRPEVVVIRFGKI